VVAGDLDGNAGTGLPAGRRQLRRRDRTTMSQAPRPGATTKQRPLIPCRIAYTRIPQQGLWSLARPATPAVRPRRDATRRRVIEAAQRLFTEHGYPAPTIDAIAGAADAPLPTLYRLFGSKRALLAAVLDTTFGGDDQPIAFAVAALQARGALDPGLGSSEAANMVYALLSPGRAQDPHRRTRLARQPLRALDRPLPQRTPARRPPPPASPDKSARPASRRSAAAKRAR
jgi:AcrR family transcriptional regulator